MTAPASNEHDPPAPAADGGPAPSRLDEISIAELVGLVWRRKWVVIASVATALILAVAYLHVARYEYTASLSVSPVSTERSGLGGAMGKLGDLADWEKNSPSSTGICWGQRACSWQSP